MRGRERETKNIWTRKIKRKEQEGMEGKKGFNMDEGLANVEEGSVTRGDKKR